MPALLKLKLVAELELRGRGDVQLYRVELGGPDQLKITKDIASDAKVRVSIPRSHFNELVEHGDLRHWREAFESGHARAQGPPPTLKLIAAGRAHAGRARPHPSRPRPRPPLLSRLADLKSS